MMGIYLDRDRFVAFMDLIRTQRFVKVEYDYNWCQKRSPVAHLVSIGENCDCLQNKEMPFAPIYKKLHEKAEHIFYMSMGQLLLHKSHLGPVVSHNISVLSSCFSDDTIDKLLSMGEGDEGDKWLIVGGKNQWHSWCKGVQTAQDFAKSNEMETKVVVDVSHSDLMEEMRDSCGLIFLPNNPDTCPRIVIEAKLMSRNIIMNENVQHKEERWFKDKEPKDVGKYLKSRPQFFWNTIL